MKSAAPLLLFLFCIPARADICARTPQIVAALEEYTLKKCAQIERSDLADITGANLFYKNISALKAYDFEGFTSLVALDLSNNQIAELPENIFKKIPTLKYLSLDGNRLIRVSRGDFQSLASLESLGLADNLLQEVPADLLLDLRGLRTLSFHGNFLSRLPAGFFQGLKSLDTLILHNNRLQSLDESAFEGLESLRFLSLNRNELRELEPNLFAGLRSIEELFLGHNRLTALPETLFDGVRTLKRFWFSSGNPFSSEEIARITRQVREKNSGVDVQSSAAPVTHSLEMSQSKAL